MEKLFKFSLKFDNAEKTINKTNGLNLRELSELFRLIDIATETLEPTFITLLDISENCQMPILATSSEERYKKLKELHERIPTVGLSNLPTPEQNYGKFLKKTLEASKITTLELYDTEDVPFFMFSQENIVNDIKNYKEIGTITGVITRIGSKNLKSRTHIDLEGIDYSIFTSKEQDEQLRQFYRGKKIRLQIEKKISISTKKVLSATLRRFKPLSGGNFLTNIMNLSDEDVKAFKFDDKNTFHTYS